MILTRVFGIGQEPISGDAVVILKDEENKRYLHLIIGLAEARAIATQLENVSAPRPLTHDLLASFCRTLGCRVRRVLINDLRNNVFFARIQVEANGQEHEIDSRPSDGIALALRLGVPIFVEEKVLEEAGVRERSSEEGGSGYAPAAAEASEEKKAESASSLEMLERRLQTAVTQENYEEAALLRDEIQKLKDSPEGAP